LETKPLVWFPKQSKKRSFFALETLVSKANQRFPLFWFPKKGVNPPPTRTTNRRFPLETKLSLFGILQIKDSQKKGFAFLVFGESTFFFGRAKAL